jgi:hypothetical protein
MARECTVCAHPDAILINEELVLEKASNRAITSRYGLGKDAVRRHRQHIPEMLSRAARAEEVAEADNLLDRLEDLQHRTEAILDRVEQTENYGAMLGAVREMRNNLEIIGELKKELNRAPTLNLQLSPEWLEVKAVILSAVERNPEILGEIEAAFDKAGALNA